MKQTNNNNKNKNTTKTKTKNNKKLPVLLHCGLSEIKMSLLFARNYSVAGWHTTGPVSRRETGETEGQQEQQGIIT